jgi:CRP/FNR family transcriptional regulator, cyclic AMP receptor protein
MTGSIFDKLSSGDAKTVKGLGTRVTVPEGWSPINQGTGSDKAYILLEGEASVRKGGEEIARVGPGAVLGEMSIVNHTLRTASVVSLTDLVLLHYTREKFEKLLTDVPGFRDALDELARERIGG